jgi:hypothetical protein
LEVLLLLPVQEIEQNVFEYIVKEIFMLNEIELRKGCDCYKNG